MEVRLSEGTDCRVVAACAIIARTLCRLSQVGHTINAIQEYLSEGRVMCARDVEW